MLIGFIGKPSVGKSTFFKAATLAEVEIASYPFTTIKPNHGVGYVKIDCLDKEFNTQCNPNHGFCINHKRFVPIDLMDVAGLVPGASEGKGLGNQFLDDLRQADVFVNVVDISGTTDEGGKPTENYDVSNDVVFLEEELDVAYKMAGKRSDLKSPKRSDLEEADAKLSLPEVTMENYKEIEKLAPFGLGNPKPVFLFENVEIAELKLFGKEKNHLELILVSGNSRKVKAISFFSTDTSFNTVIEKGKKINLLASFDLSHFGGRTELRLRFVDIL